MRLIDADTLLMYIADVQLSNMPDIRDSKEVQEAQKEIYDMFGDFFNIIKERQTAYDVDKVRRQILINGCSFESHCDGAEHGNCLKCSHYSINTDKAIDIVRKGGV